MVFLPHGPLKRSILKENIGQYGLLFLVAHLAANWAIRAALVYNVSLFEPLNHPMKNPNLSHMTIDIQSNLNIRTF